MVNRYAAGFVGVVALLIIAVASVDLNPSGEAFKQGPCVQRVELLSSGYINGRAYFAYRFNCQEQSTVCKLLLDGEEAGRQGLLKGRTGYFAKELTPDYHSWRVECRRGDGTWVSSRQGSLRI